MHKINVTNKPCMTSVKYLLNRCSDIPSEISQIRGAGVPQKHSVQVATREQNLNCLYQEGWGGQWEEGGEERARGRFTSEYPHFFVGTLQPR